MSSFDVQVKEYIITYVLPILIFLGTLVVFENQYKNLYLKIYAHVVNNFGISHSKLVSAQKETLFRELHLLCEKLDRPLTILEIGAGGGTNFRYFPDETDVICVDPNPYFEEHINERISEFKNLHLKGFVTGEGEDLAWIPDGSIDAVVCTLVMCSMENVPLFLKEVKRMLIKGGKFCFLEHVAEQKKNCTHYLQNFLQPIWKVIARCDLNNTMWLDIKSANFNSLILEFFTVETKIKVINPHVMGTATK